MAISSLTSKTISALRFPLIIGVVLLHTYIVDSAIGGNVYVSSGKFPGFDWFEHIYRVELANISVPLFFFISGFLFFNGLSTFDWRRFGEKLKKRIHSLLFPFLFWNIAFLLFVAFVHEIAPSLLTSKKSFLEMSPGEIANCFWELSQGLIPLWFLRDLMIINLFSPVIFWLLHNKWSKWLMGLLLIVYLSQYYHYLPGLGLRCSYPYMLGAWFSINGKDLVTELQKYLWPLTLFFLSVICVDSVLWSQHLEVFAINRLGQISGVLVMFIWASKAVAQHLLSTRDLYSKGSFFVFVFHMFIIYIPAKLWVYVMPVNGWTATVALITIPLLVGYSCLGIYFLLQRFFPTMTGWMIGERS